MSLWQRRENESVSTLRQQWTSISCDPITPRSNYIRYSSLTGLDTMLMVPQGLDSQHAAMTNCRCGRYMDPIGRGHGRRRSIRSSPAETIDDNDENIWSLPRVIPSWPPS